MKNIQSLLRLHFLNGQHPKASNFNNLQIIVGILLLAILLTAALGMYRAVIAAPAATYSLNWYSINGGGAFIAGDEYHIAGDIGQADAGYLMGGNYQIIGGGRVEEPPVKRLFLPLVIR